MKPIIVYRIEHKDTGEGPFKFDENRYDLDDNAFFILTKISEKFRAKFPPVKYDMPNGYKFGFQDKDSFAKYIGVKYLKQLAELGWIIKAYKTDSYMLFNKGEVIFNKRKANLAESLNEAVCKAIDKLLHEFKLPSDAQFWADVDKLGFKGDYRGRGKLIAKYPQFFVSSKKTLSYGEDESDAADLFYSRVDDLLVDLHNKNKLKRKPTPGEWLLTAILFKDKVINSQAIRNNASIHVYKGVPASRINKVKESLKVKGLSSWTTDKEVAIRFTNAQWANVRAFAYGQPKVGYILETQVPLSQVAIFNNVGYEKEVLLQTPIHNIKFNKYEE